MILHLTETQTAMATNERQLDEASDHAAAPSSLSVPATAPSSSSSAVPSSPYALSYSPSATQASLSSSSSSSGVGIGLGLGLGAASTSSRTIADKSHPRGGQTDMHGGEMEEEDQAGQQHKRLRVTDNDNNNNSNSIHNHNHHNMLGSVSVSAIQNDQLLGHMANGAVHSNHPGMLHSEIMETETLES